MFRSEGGVATAGVFSGHVHGFAQAGVAGFGEPAVAAGEPEESRRGTNPEKEQMPAKEAKR